MTSNQTTDTALERVDGDVVDLGEIWAALRRNFRWVLVGALLGLVAGAAATRLLRPQYQGTTKVVLRGQEGGASAALAQLGGLASLIPGKGASGFDTEMEVLMSRSVIGAVVDSLGLQAVVADPVGSSPGALFAAAAYPATLREGKYTFRREGDRYRVEGPTGAGIVTPGAPARVGGATLTLRREGLPREFAVSLLDRESAIDVVTKKLEPSKLDGDVARITFRSESSLLAAGVPNALVSQYLKRRTTTDRGVNQTRYEFLLQHEDSVGNELARASQALRRYQEQSGVLDPELQGKVEVERAMSIRADAEQADVEIRALEKVLAQGAAGRLAPRDLAAYPTFLKNPAINDVLSRLLEAESKRTLLGERRTERDPEIVALGEQIRGLEAQLVSTSTAYLESLRRQRTELQSELGQYSGTLAALPAQSMETFRLQRDVKRLTETQLALQAQMVQTRLAAIGEAGSVQQVDAAVAPRHPVFPKLYINLAIGLAGGLLVGLVGAFGNAYLGQSVREPRDAELATGLPATRFRPDAPLLLGGAEHLRSLLVLPAGSGASSGTVARKIAATAALQGRVVALVDFESLLPPPQHPGPGGYGAVALAGNGNGAPHALVRLTANGASPAYPVYGTSWEALEGGGVRPAVAELERECSLVVVALPALDHESTAALLSSERPVVIVARAGSVTRAELQDAVSTLRRVGINVSGVILQTEERSGGRRA